MSISQSMEYEELNSKINPTQFLMKYLPDGKRIGSEWVSLNPTRNDSSLGSFKVNVNTVEWSDFATGDAGGDLISLYAYLHCGNSNSKALKELTSIYGNHIPVASKKPKEDKTKLICPVPEGAGFPSENNFTGRWKYTDCNDQVLMYVTRYDPHGKKKTYCQWTYRELANGSRKWMREGLDGHKKPIYKAYDLVLRPNARVLIPEGEKAADAAQRLMPDWVVVTVQGGSGVFKQADISLLKDREVVLWPDNDEKSKKAMNDLYKLLRGHAKSVKGIKSECLESKTKGWDLADGEAEGVTYKDIMEVIDAAPEKINLTFPDLSANDRPLNTSHNIAYLLDVNKIDVKYNLMTNYPEFYAEGKSFSKVNEVDCYFVEICNLCVKSSVPKVDLSSHLLYISDKNRYHPAINFIESKPWDGIKRVQNFIKTVEADNQDLANKIIYRWMIGCVAAAYADNGISLEGALVFQGKQKIGKTSWFLNLVPKEYQYLIKSDLSVNPDNKDDVMKVTSCWLGELSEIDGIIKKSEVSAQKTFLSRSIDELRVPFGKRTRQVPRRTSYFGSVNPVEFLSDTTGNRRYWVIAANKINYNHDFDMQQVWAEIKIDFNNGESYRLTYEEQNTVNDENESFMHTDPLEEAILERFDWESPYRNYPKTCKEVLERLGFMITDSNLSRESRKVGSILSKLTGKKSRKSGGKSLYDLPKDKLVPDKT